MSKNNTTLSILHRLADGAEAGLYGTGAVVAGTVTAVAGTAAAASVVSAVATLGVGLIATAPLAALTWAGAGATTYFGSKAIHKGRHAAGKDSTCHALHHTVGVMSFGKAY